MPYNFGWERSARGFGILLLISVRWFIIIVYHHEVGDWHDIDVLSDGRLVQEQSQSIESLKNHIGLVTTMTQSTDVSVDSG